jgi:hypothetical protein
MKTAPTETTTAAPVELDLDARLAMVGAVMDERLALANVAFEVDTAHISAAEPLPEVVASPRLVPVIAPCPYSAPIAAALHRARVRLQTDGWTRDTLVGEQGHRCPIGAIRAEAGSRAEADDACVLLLEAIRRDFPGADTIPSWNDAQSDPRLPMRYIDRAASLADTRGL